MKEGQAVTLELLIVFAVLVVFISGYGKKFWSVLLTNTPYTIKPPQITLPSLTDLAKGGSKVGIQ
jgi:hypothetical protein